MTDEQITLKTWLALCRRAGQMKPDQFNTWAFMVGSDGPLEQRIEIGKLALRRFGIRWDYQTYRINGAEDTDAE